MIPCLPPSDVVPAPSWKAPPLSCDCHFHIFGPYDRFPLDAGRHYDPPAALIPAYRRVADALGIQRMVIVQPSVYGNDNRATLDAARQFGLDRARVVAVVDPAITDAALRALHDGGTGQTARPSQQGRGRGPARQVFGIKLHRFGGGVIPRQQAPAGQ